MNDETITGITILYQSRFGTRALQPDAHITSVVGNIFIPMGSKYCNHRRKEAVLCWKINLILSHIPWEYLGQPINFSADPCSVTQDTPPFLEGGGVRSYSSVLVIIIIIIMSRRQHGYPWPSLGTSPYHSSPPAGLQHYILCPHIVAVFMSSSLHLQQCPAYLVRLTWYSFCDGGQVSV